MLDHLQLVPGQAELLEDQRIALHDLAGGEADRDVRGLSVVFNQVHDGVQAAVYCAAGIVCVAEVHAAGAFLIVRDVQRMVDQLADALVLRSGNRHDRDTQHGLHFVDADGTAVGGHLIHHVEGEHHRYAQLHQLHGEIEVAGQVGRIDDVDDAARLFPEDKLAHDQLLARIRRHGVDAWQVGHQRIGMPADDAVLAVDCYAGEVAHVLVCAGELVKERRLAAVLVAGKGECKLYAGGKR